MANAVLLVLSMTIGLFFILMGLIKLTPAFNDDVYREMRKVFIRSAKVFPLAAQMGWKPNPHMFRRIVGTTEVVCGTLLAIVPGPIKEIANVILFGMMCGAVYIHYALKDGIEKMTPALVFGLLLGCRFIVHLQVKAREARQEREEKARQAKEGESRHATRVEDKKEQ